MASSRIFVRGLPPTFTEDEFRSHFSTQRDVTDVKLFPHRRIGYVGYKTPEDATKAAKYFNKSFIRMSKIWVEVARPISNEAPFTSYNMRQRDAPIDSLDKSRMITTSNGEETLAQNTLKRKRPGSPAAEADPKLQEFLQVMQPPSKTKIWSKEGALPNTEAEDQAVVIAQAETANESDDEYQVVSKKPKSGISGQPEAHSVPSHPSVLARPKENQDEAQNEESGEDRPLGGGVPLTDADWLRSRTNRRMDLDQDDGVAVVSNQGATQPQRQVDEPAAEVADEAQVEDAPDSNESTILATGRLFLRNLLFKVTEDDLKETFGKIGSVEAHVPIDGKSGQGKGIAYVQYSDPAQALEAYRQLDGSIFQGRLLHILPAVAKRESRIDDVAISKLPLKKQKQLQKKNEASKATFSWNSLYMNADAVMSSVAARLGVDKAQLLDPTSSDAAVKQAHAETHIISETKAYFAQNGVDLDAFKKRERGDTAILIKNFPYGTTSDDLRTLFEEHGQLKRLLMPPSGTIAIAEFAQAPSARSAFSTLAFRKIKDSILYLEKAPKNLFSDNVTPQSDIKSSAPGSVPVKASAQDLLGNEATEGGIDTSTLFVRNLNFTTTTARLTDVFGSLDGFLSARVKTKTDPKKPGQLLSMGFGFFEFRTKEQAQAALAAIDGYNLDGHPLIIKASHKGLDAAAERRKEDQAKKAAAKQTKIVVKNLPFEATKKDVRALLSPYGQLKSVRVPKKFDHSTRGFAFAEFITPREAENAMEALRSTHLLGRRLVLEYSAGDPEDAEAEIEQMQKKVGSQINKVALQNLTGTGRRKFNVSGDDDIEDR